MLGSLFSLQDLLIGSSFSETLVAVYQAMQRHIPGDGNLHSLCHENLKSFLLYFSLLLGTSQKVAM
jgi:hypothetical protein